MVEWWMVDGGEERDFVDGVFLKVDFFERLEVWDMLAEPLFLIAERWTAARAAFASIEILLNGAAVLRQRRDGKGILLVTLFSALANKNRDESLSREMVLHK